MKRVLTILVPPTGPITEIYGERELSTEDVEQVIIRLQSIVAYRKEVESETENGPRKCPISRKIK